MIFLRNFVEKIQFIIESWSIALSYQKKISFYDLNYEKTRTETRSVLGKLT